MIDNFPFISQIQGRSVFSLLAVEPVVCFVCSGSEAFFDPRFGPHGGLPMTGRLRLHTWAIIALAVWPASGSVFGGGTIYDGPLVGMDDLIKRIGRENVPTGAGVMVGQVEAPNLNGNFYPNQGHADFVGKTFTLMSGSSGNSGHATNVGRNYYGLDTSIAPGITDIFLWEVNHWLASGYLFFNGPANSPPFLPPKGLKIFNNSWIGNAGNNTSNIILRRADFAIARDDLLMMSGVNNGAGGNVPLMSHTFNGLAVGKLNGAHQSGSTLTGIDSPGRLKPDIVAPGNATSWSTPVVGAAAAMMIETARTVPIGGINPNAERSDVIKVVLLAGATKTNAHGLDWTNNPQTSGPDRGITTQPIDAVIGAGNVNVNFAHMIMTGGEQDGADTPPNDANAMFAGWDLATVGLDESRYWRFDVPQFADAVSMLVTWHRNVQVGFGNSDWAVADFDLILWRVDENGDLATLVGDPGLLFFAGGNVVSASAVDNIEHLYITGLEPGEYTLELRRVDALGGFPDWEAAVAWLLPEPPGIPGDLDGDGSVGVKDLLILLGSWGLCPDCNDCPADIDGDCSVGVKDLLILLGNWG